MQRAIGRVLSPLWVPVTTAVMRVGFGWTIEGVAETRRTYRELCRSRSARLVCANHLTLVDSAVIAWALGSSGWFLLHYATLPWNVPERENFAFSVVSRLVTYVMKCVPITRGGDRAAVGRVLARLVYLLERGETVLVFPEGGRSRSGAVDLENAAYGVGRVIAALPECDVLCVYLRGERQKGYSDLPATGERFRVRVESFRPTSALRGMRRARDLAQQVVGRLAALERQHFTEAR
ncbi:MAG: 1-acyl-sn-glycerol-3-phosphate acyltransferase [Deltaproteobacteria bacterium]|nr:1-acyl-sn-glycerol-3-phosphate acyltransferase [Deltaproteobacteria bacterium]